MTQQYVYTVRYRQAHIPNRLMTLIVGAKDADDARKEAAILDPDFGWTVESPRRGREIENPVIACHYCERIKPIQEGRYVRVQFETGIELVCDDCVERGHDEPDEEDYAEWRGCLVEVAD